MGPESLQQEMIRLEEEETLAREEERFMATAAELRAQADLVELEEKLVKAKDTKAGPSRELKNEVRRARQKAREARER